MESVADVVASHIVAQVEKALSPYVGRLAYLRVYSGKLRAGASVLNATRGIRERTGRVLEAHANHREEVEEAVAGAAF